MSYLAAYPVRVAYSYRCNNTHDEQIADHDRATRNIKLPAYTYRLQKNKQ